MIPKYPQYFIYQAGFGWDNPNISHEPPHFCGNLKHFTILVDWDGILFEALRGLGERKGCTKSPPIPDPLVDEITPLVNKWELLGSLG
jgi:hypothetical protein